MKRLTTSFVGRAHSYTQSELPWLLDEYRPVEPNGGASRKFGWKLFHYISGGGMKTFGRTIAQEESDAKRNRFLAASAAVAAAWIIFWF